MVIVVDGSHSSRLSIVQNEAVLDTVLFVQILSLVSDDEITLAQLSEESGIPARTIRFYISRGLSDGPSKAGRGAAYTAQHLARLEQINALQSEGRMLSEIGPILSPGQQQPALSSTA